MQKVITVAISQCRFYKDNTLKPKKCKNCGESFTPDRPFQKCCKFSCAIDYVAVVKAKEQKTTQRKALKQFSDRDIPTLKRLAQTVFNKYIRERDNGKPCVSCHYVWSEEGGRKKNAGHYRPAGNCGQHRYNENNVFLQCEQCNTYKSGNLAEYRLELINRIGIKEVEKLESDNTPKKWTADELHEIIKTYKQKIKDLSVT